MKAKEGNEPIPDLEKCQMKTMHELTTVTHEYTYRNISGYVERTLDETISSYVDVDILLYGWN